MAAGKINAMKLDRNLFTGLVTEWNTWGAKCGGAN
jgi:hypothetical protein